MLAIIKALRVSSASATLWRRKCAEHVRLKAIGAYGSWKARSKVGIDTVAIDTPVAVIRREDQCVFGGWLHGSTLSATDRASEHFAAVRDLHAQSHSPLRVSQRRRSKAKEAARMMSLRGEYAVVSARLTAAMMEWKSNLDEK